MPGVPLKPWLRRLLPVLLLTACNMGTGEGKAPPVTALDHETHTHFPINSGAHTLADCNTCHGEFDTFKQYSCVSCHDHSPENTDPNHVVVADYAWNGTSCFECHPDGKAEAVDHTTRFPIGAGTLHAGITCSTCHVDPKTRKVVDCIGCHTHSPANTEPIHTGIPNYAYTSAKCLECHPQATIPGINHTFFPIGTGTTHTGISCSTCHPDRANRKVVNCTGCHSHTATNVDPIHTGIPGYAYTSPKCLECHPQGNILGIDHTAFFPIHMGTKHAGTACSKCHLDRTNRSLLDCLTCHSPTSTDPRHSQVGGYARDSALCVRCHGDSQVHPVAAHLPFNISSGTFHYRTSCLRCHPTARTDKTYAQNFNIYDCLACHERERMAGKHDKFPSYRYVSTTCTSSGCHPNGR